MTQVDGMNAMPEKAMLPPFRQRFWPVLTLLFLAPWVGEYLLGNVPGPMLYLIPFLIPMYGGGAVLVRELAVRLRLGWPGILLLGLAYGIAEAGLADQSLFSRDFDGQDFVTATWIPALGIHAHNAVSFLEGHAVWSITLPIAFTTFLFPGMRERPWLGLPGLFIMAALFIGGCWIINTDHLETGGIVATPLQRLSAVLAILAAIGLALWSRRLRFPALKPPSPVLIGLGAFVLGSMRAMMPESWGGVAGECVIIAVTAMLALAFSRHGGFTARHGHALASGLLLVYAWLGFVLTLLIYEGEVVFYAWNAAFALAALALIWISRPKSL